MEIHRQALLDFAQLYGEYIRKVLVLPLICVDPLCVWVYVEDEFLEETRW
jgi:hypothetical protein